jgi:uncharacterized protein YqeY
MPLVERMDAELVEARKRRDDLSLNTLGLLKSELVKASKEPGAGGIVDDELLVRVARREVKRREEAAAGFRSGGREESALREEAEAEVLRGYLPPSLSAEELDAEVKAVIEELQPSGPQAFGAIMKAATARLAGRAQGGDIAAAARRLLG